MTSYVGAWRREGRDQHSDVVMSLPSPLPNFLGIGAPRAGTTWLHSLLVAHPDVLMPSRRKELHFFDAHYGRGLDWYARSYTLPSSGEVAPRVGEITPTYMYKDECILRIATLGLIDKFIVCVRNPVDLLWSSYKHNSTILDFCGDIDDFMEDFPHVVQRGLYAQALAPWIKQFGNDHFFFLRLDDLAADPVGTREEIAEFLGINPHRFPSAAGLNQVNPSVAPRFRRLYSLGKRSIRLLGSVDQTWVVRLGKRLGIRRMLISTSKPDSSGPPEEIRRSLSKFYAEDLVELNRLVGLDVRPWLPMYTHNEGEPTGLHTPGV